MSRGTCELCGAPDSILRKISIASKYIKRACINCCNDTIEHAERLKKDAATSRAMGRDYWQFVKPRK